MQLRFCEALLMLRMNAACSLVFFAAAPSPPLPSANDSSRRCVKSRLHTGSSLSVTFYFRKTADVGCVYSVSSHWNGRRKCIWIYLQITTSLCSNTGQNYDEKKSIHIKNRAWSPSLLLPSITFFTLSYYIIPRSIHITKAPNLSWSSFPSLLPFPPSRFLHCCCRQLLYHQFSCNSCGLCQDMEHRLGGSSQIRQFSPNSCGLWQYSSPYSYPYSYPGGQRPPAHRRC